MALLASLRQASTFGYRNPRTLTLSVLATLWIATPGCSALIGADPPRCENNDQCAVLNELEGIGTDACELYQCATETDRCVLQARDVDRDGLVAAECADSPLAQGIAVDCNDLFAGGAEVCNGVDDDCDGVIDEQFMADDMLVSPLPAERPEVLGSFGGIFGRVAFSAEPSGLATVHSQSDGTASLLFVDGTSVTGPSALASSRAEDLTALTNIAIEPGCHTMRADGTIGSGTCTYEDVSVGVTEENLFVTYVSRGGCADGQLRAGYIERTQLGSLSIIERGPARRSNVFSGIDIDRSLTGGAPCTGAARGDGLTGAARPAVAAMDRTGGEDQALAAWLAAPFGRAECGGAPANVEVLALHVQQDTFGETYGWVTASNEGRPQIVGQTVGGGRPGVGVWEGVGYLIAFGETAGIRLVFVTMPESPQDFERTGAPDDRTGIETEPLALADLGLLAAMNADDIAVSFGSIRTGGVDVGIAWREGCGSGAERVFFRQVFLERDGDTISLGESLSASPVELTPNPAPTAGPPALAYAFSGLLQPGVERADGRPTGTSQNDGGWYIAWEDGSNPELGGVEDQRVYARRVSEADGALIDSDELIALHPPGDLRRTRPTVYRDGENRVRFGFFEDGDGITFLGGALACTNREE